MKRSDFLSLMGVSSLLGVLGGLAKRTEAKGEGEVVNLAMEGSAPNLNPLTNGTGYATTGFVTYSELLVADQAATWLADDQVPNWHDLAFIDCCKDYDPATGNCTITAKWSGPLDAMVAVSREIVETPNHFNYWDKTCKAFGLVLVGKHFGNMGSVLYYYRRDPSKSPSATQFSFTLSDGEIVAMEWKDGTHWIATAEGNVVHFEPDPDVARFCEAMDANSGDGTFDSAAMDKALKWMMQAS